MRVSCVQRVYLISDRDRDCPIIHTVDHNKEHIFMQAKLVSHHIGARGYGVSFNFPNTFIDDSINVLYDADSNAIAELEAGQQGAQAQTLGEVHIVPYCIGQRNEKRVLNITANSYASSILDPNDMFFGYTCEVPLGQKTYDVTYEDMMQIVQKVDVDVRSLDSLFGQAEISQDLKPDLLSIDTQGLELEILKGASGIIGQSTLAIISEIEFLPMYKNQPLFQDIAAMADKLGFLFAGFTHLQEISVGRPPIGVRAKGIPGFGDALFVRKPETLASMFSSDDGRYVAYHKLAFVALALGYIDYALHVLNSLKECEPSDSVREAMAGRNYYTFAKEFQAACAALPVRYPMLLGIPPHTRANVIKDGYVHPESDGKTASSGSVSARLHEQLRGMYDHLRSRFGRSVEATAPESMAETQVEEILRRYGLHAVAGLVQTRRNQAEAGLPHPHEYM